MKLTSSSSGASAPDGMCFLRPGRALLPLALALVLVGVVSASAQFTWTARDSARNWTALSSSADGTKVVAVGGDTTGMANPKLYRSTDSGATWTALSVQDQLWTGIASSADGTKLVACEQSSDTGNFQGGSVWTSANSGATWTMRLTAGTNNWTAVSSSDDGTKLAAIVNFGKVYVSTDSGANWTANSTDAGNAAVYRAWTSVAISPNGNRLVAVDSGTNFTLNLSGGYIYTSADDGVTWTASGVRTNWQSVASSSDGTKLVAAAYLGQIYTSADAGVTWTPRTIVNPSTTQPATNWGAVAISSDGTKMVAADGWFYDNGQIYTSTDSGANWTAQTAAGTRKWFSVTSSSDGYKLVAGVNGEQVFTGVGTPPNSAPTDIALSAASVAENAGANATVGTLSATDPDAGATHTFTLVTGAGDTDNAAFNLSGTALRLTASANFEAKNSYSIRVRATDNGSLTFEKQFTITITDMNEAPTDIALSAASVVENNAANATVGTLSATDPDAGATHTFTLVTGAGDTDNAASTSAALLFA